jgi:diaminohydroxyphosphoribosylaminopyrimidine deaminase/5-amino-6-(5-phosphoribosylamino)uracil reductase
VSSEQHHRFMARAIELAAYGLYTTDPNPRVGCVIVKDNEIVGEGWHQRAGGPHAEIAALENARGNVNGATVYVTLEPCCHHGRTPPCVDALIGAGVARVVIAGLDPNPLVAGKGVERLAQAGIDVEQGVLQEQAEQLNPGFSKRMRQQLPFVRCKVAMSLDGRTAMASGESQWITGPDARKDVQHWRARSSAIMTGIGTVLADDPSLNVRLSGEPLSPGTDFTDADQPLRVVLDSRLRMPSKAKMLPLPGQTLVYTTVNTASHGQRIRELEDAGAKVITVSTRNDTVDLQTVLEDLGQRQINEVFIEAGPAVNGSAMSAGCVDELIFYIAPSLMGDQARGAFHLPTVQTMAEKVNLDIVDTRQIGVDWRIIAHPVR